MAASHILVLLLLNSSRRSNILGVIKELVTEIRLKYNVPSIMELKLEPDCKVLNNCKIQHGETLHINGTLTVKSCPTDGNMTYTIEVGPVSLDERLLIVVDVDCKCKCEMDDSREFNSEKCEGAGVRQCGVCLCNDNRYGDTCKCVRSQMDYTYLDKCKQNQNDTLDCSGRGSCVCGQCEKCNLGYSGRYCEEDVTACLDGRGVFCANHGKCIQGQCKCDQKWTGNDCSVYCTDDQQKCKTPYSDQICSGNGQCICGKCKCESCSGRFCDNCREMTEKRCKDLEDYANCNYHKNKSDCDITFNKTDETKITFANASEMTSPKWLNAKWCKKQLEDNSVLIFRFDYNETFPSVLQIIIQKDLYLPPKSNVWVVAGSTVGVVLLIGLLTLIAWKILVDMRDKREYDNFVKNVDDAGCNTTNNALYEQPFVQFSNPSFRVSRYDN